MSATIHDSEKQKEELRFKKPHAPPIVAGIYLNARLVSLRIPKRFTIGYESAFGIRQFASLLQGASG